MLHTILSVICIEFKIILIRFLYWQQASILIYHTFVSQIMILFLELLMKKNKKLEWQIYIQRNKYDLNFFKFLVSFLFLSILNTICYFFIKYYYICFFRFWTFFSQISWKFFPQFSHIYLASLNLIHIKVKHWFILSKAVTTIQY